MSFVLTQVYNIDKTEEAAEKAALSQHTPVRSADRAMLWARLNAAIGTDV